MRTIVSSELCSTVSECRGGWSRATSGLLLTLVTLAAGCGASSYDADTGFRPEKDGFGFANYGSEAAPTDLDAARMQELFGDKICASKVGAKCLLTPPGERWRTQVNHLFGAGHCEGMVVLSSLLFAKTNGLTPSRFGAAMTSELQLTNNQTLETEIAKWGSTQLLASTSLGEFGSKNTPTEVIEKLRQMWSAGEYPTLRVRHREMLDGHSFFPYRIVDKGDKTLALKVYDPDYPKQDREITFDLHTNQWSYVFSMSADGTPYKYEGNATSHNLYVMSTGVRLGKQDCPFCAGGAGSNQATMDPTSTTFTGTPGLQFINTNLLQQPLLVLPKIDSSYTSYQGALGTDGNEVSKLPGIQTINMAVIFPRLLNGSGPSPLIQVPSAYDTTIKLQGNETTKDKPSSLTLTGPGYELVVEDIVLHPGQEDTVLIPKGQGQITYTTRADETPTVTVGFESSGADYELSIVADGPPTGISISIKKDETKGEFSFQIKGALGYTMQMVRIDEKGEQVFSHDGATITEDDTIIVKYGSWQGQGSPLTLQIDDGSNGTIDETIQIVDEDLPRM